MFSIFAEIFVHVALQTHCPVVVAYIVLRELTAERQHTRLSGRDAIFGLSQCGCIPAFLAVPAFDVCVAAAIGGNGIEEQPVLRRVAHVDGSLETAFALFHVTVVELVEDIVAVGTVAA